MTETNQPQPSDARPSDKVRKQAKQAYQAGDSKSAFKLLQQAMLDDPENYKIPLELAALQLETENYHDAEETLKKLPINEQQSDQVKTLNAYIQFGFEATEIPSLEEVKKQLQQTPKDSLTQYQAGLRYALDGQHEVALEHFFTLFKTDRKFQDDAGRKSMLSIFDMLGNQPIVKKYRSQMMRHMY
jgi:putative thioredoxin